MGSVVNLILDVLVWVAFGTPDKMHCTVVSCICGSRDSKLGKRHGT